jgi:hypothetical protein
MPRPAVVTTVSDADQTVFPVGPLVPLPRLTREEVRVLEEVEALWVTSSGGGI